MRYRHCSSILVGLVFPTLGVVFLWGHWANIQRNLVLKVDSPKNDVTSGTFLYLKALPRV